MTASPASSAPPAPPARRLLRAAPGLLALIALALAAGCSGGPSRGPAADRPAPREGTLVMSWNIRFGTADDGPNSWPRRADRVAAAIVDPFDTGASPADPAFDIVGIQEALRFQIDQLLAAAPAYAYAGAGRDDGIDAGEHCGILYRADRFELADAGVFWLSDTPGVPASTTWGNELPRICTWARLIPLDADPEAPGNQSDTGPAGIYIYNTHLDHRSEASRREAVELIAFRIDAREHPEEPVILMGDFNAAPDSIERRYLTGAAEDPTGDGVAPASPALFDVLDLSENADAPRGTFNGWRYDADRPGPDIDSILVGGLTILDARVERALGVSEDGRPPSDHYPIVARLKRD